MPPREENGFAPDPQDLLAAITDRTKVIILNSPCNPTGAVIEKARYDAIIDVLKDREIFIIADEVYSRLVYADEYTSITGYKDILDRVVYINGFSKMFAMTGWRLGYAIAREDIITNMTKLHENGASCLPAPTQLAAAYGLVTCLPKIEEMRLSYLRRRNLICSLINKIPGFSVKTPNGAFYAFANVKPVLAATGMNSKELCMDILKNTGCVTVPGSGFGECGEGFIRITYATSDEKIIEGMKRIKEYISSLGLAL